MRPSRLLVVSAALAWLLAGAPLVRPGIPVAAVVAWLLSAVGFAAHARSRTIRGGLGWLAVQAVAAVALAVAGGSFRSGAVLLIVVAAQLPVRVATPWAIIWIVVQTASLFVATGSTLVGLAALAASELLAAGTATLAESERVARAELAAAHLRLERHQELRLQSARQAERLRIARDLHDGLGHRLTALGLALEAARHMEGPPALREQMARARLLNQAALDELRGTVGNMRDADAHEIALWLEGLGRAVPQLALEVRVDDGVRIEDPATATEVFRICQEVVTNAARHAPGRQLRLYVGAVGDRIVLRGQTDGSPVRAFVPGHGLRGIEERARLLGGEAEIVAGPEGFSVTVRFPRERTL